MTQSNGITDLSILGWMLALGGTGFVAGFFGPIALDPGANQGPLVGIFITGPAGVVGGLVLGAIFQRLPVSTGVRLWVLASMCVLLGLGTLYSVLPQPTVIGDVIDASVERCSLPASNADAAMVQWEQAVQRVTWATPPADWKHKALANLAQDSGVVLGMRVVRRRSIYQHHKPWDSWQRSAGPWVMDGSVKDYYATDEGDACAPYLARNRALYTPLRDPTSDPTRPAVEWPPTDTKGFLQLMELGPVPAEYRQLF